MTNSPRSLQKATIVGPDPFDPSVIVVQYNPRRLGCFGGSREDTVEFKAETDAADVATKGA